MRIVRTSQSATQQMGMFMSTNIKQRDRDVIKAEMLADDEGDGFEFPQGEDNDEDGYRLAVEDASIDVDRRTTIDGYDTKSDQVFWSLSAYQKAVKVHRDRQPLNHTERQKYNDMCIIIEDLEVHGSVIEVPAVNNEYLVYHAVVAQHGSDPLPPEN